MNKCICQNPNKSLKNTHYMKRNIKLSLIGDALTEINKGIVLFENGMAIATFDIKFCPICGKELIVKNCNNCRHNLDYFDCSQCEDLDEWENEN